MHPLDLGGGGRLTGATVVPSFCYRRREKFEGYAEAPLELECTGDMEADVRSGELRFLERFERHLSAEPWQWAVLERVWEDAPAAETAGGTSETLASRA